MINEKKQHKKARFFDQSSQQNFQHSANIKQFLKSYLSEIGKDKLYQTLQYIKSEKSTSSYLDSLVTQIISFLESQSNSPTNILHTSKTKNKIKDLVYIMERKLIDTLISFMKTNNLLSSIKTSKLFLIASSYSCKMIFKNSRLSFCKEKSHNNIFYLYSGSLEKVQRFPELKAKGNVALVEEKPNLDDLQVILPSIKKKKSKKKESLDSNIKQQQIKNLNPKLSKQNFVQLKTLVQAGHFIGDQWLCTEITQKPITTVYKVVTENAILIQFSAQIIQKIITQFNYIQQSQSFYEQKLDIEAKKAKSLKQINKKHKLLVQKRQQDKLKRQLSPQMLEAKHTILKRYCFKQEHSIDTKSPKQISRLLFKCKRNLKAKTQTFDTPLVEVFNNFSEKKRCHEGNPLSPMAIVKTRINDSLLNKSDNVLSKGQKSMIYQVKSWQSSASLSEESLTPSMKIVKNLVDRRNNHSCSSFQLLEINRVIDKFKRQKRRNRY